MNTILKSNEDLLMEINEFIHNDSKKKDYHFKHITLVAKYAKLINQRMGFNLNNKKLSFVALAHDLLKERSLNPKKDGTISWKTHPIPQDLNRYVRMNLDILDKFELGDYFNTDIGLHPLAAGIWLYKELGIKDPEILYPIMFHSCPVISVYKTLPIRIQRMVDIITLADKLSSNYLKINLLEVDVKVDLDQLVFGIYGTELNYTFGLYIARLISAGKSNEAQSNEASDFFFKRLQDVNPFISKEELNKHMGGSKKWPKRKSQAFKIP